MQQIDSKAGLAAITPQRTRSRPNPRTMDQQALLAELVAQGRRRERRQEKEFQHAQKLQGALWGVIKMLRALARAAKDSGQMAMFGAWLPRDTSHLADDGAAQDTRPQWLVDLPENWGEMDADERSRYVAQTALGDE